MKKHLLYFLLCTVAVFCSRSQTVWEVSTFAGTGVSGSVNSATPTAASFQYPGWVCGDNSGNMFVSEGNRIRKISSAGVVSTFAGSGVAGYKDGIGTDARFNFPSALWSDASGNIYVIDADNQRIRKISPAGQVSTLAGSGATGSIDGPGNTASFNFSAFSGICIDLNDNCYVSDTYNNKIRKIDPSGNVSTFAGSGLAGTSDGTGAAAEFDRPTGICAAGFGDLYVCDAGNYSIRKITFSQVVSTFPNAPHFTSMPIGISPDFAGNFFVTHSNAIKKITSSGAVSLIAGSESAAGLVNGIGTAARFSLPVGIGLTASGRYVVDCFNHQLRKIEEKTPVAPVVNYLDLPANICLGASSNYQPTTTGSQAELAIQVDSIAITAPKAICKNNNSVFVLNGNDSILRYDFNGNLQQVYNDLPLFLNVNAIAADNNNRLYLSAPDFTFSALTSIQRLDAAGNWDASFSTPSGFFGNISALAMGPDGNLYAADTTNGAISTIDTATGMPANLPFPNPSFSFYKPTGLAFGGNQLYVADLGNKTVLRRDAGDNNYYKVIQSLDTLNWNINSIEVDTMGENNFYLITELSSSGFAATINHQIYFGDEQIYKETNTDIGVSLNNPIGSVLVKQNGPYSVPGTWVANKGGNNVKRIVGCVYTITPALPAGLKFNFTTGKITGTPLAATPTQTYTITTQSAYGSTTKMVTFAVTPPTNLSNTPGTNSSFNTHNDGLSVTYFEANNCTRMIEIQDSVGGTMPGAVSVNQTVYPTIASFNSGTFVGRKTEVSTQDPNAKAQLKLYFTYQDIENYNLFNGAGVDLLNDTIGGTMQIGVLQLHTDTTGHIQQIKHNPIAANWKTSYQAWEVNFPVQKFSTFYAGEEQSITDFSCENSGADTIVSTNNYYIWHGDSIFSSGTYTDILVNQNGCDSVTTLELTISPTTNAFTPLLDKSLNVYPNPSAGLINIDINNPNVSAKSVRIMNILGNEIYNNTSPSSNTKVDLSQYGKGFYIVTITSQQESVTRKILIE
jgi:serine/threonine protein kinase, bacterial